MIPNQWRNFKGVLGSLLPSMIWMELGMGYMDGCMDGMGNMDVKWRI